MDITLPVKAEKRKRNAVFLVKKSIFWKEDGKRYSALCDVNWFDCLRKVGKM